MGSVSSYYEGKDVLITGGCGSVGTALLKELLKCNPKRVLVLDQNESALFYLSHEFKHNKNIRYLVGDIRDKERLRDAMHDAQVVFHAAALKHVHLCEYNPEEAIKTNIIGSKNLVEVAREFNVEKVIGISTDKAVNPINIMGATKLISEKVFLRGNRGENSTKFSCVRFGNVLNSNGSVIPIFVKQIKEGGPVTITSPEMTRFFMSMPQAAKLVLEAGAISNGMETFILKMPTVRIQDLAEAIIDDLAPKCGFGQGGIPIKYIGVRPGEKLHESLLTEEEVHRAVETDNMFILQELEVGPHLIHDGSATVGVPMNRSLGNVSSKLGKFMSKEEIKNLLREEGIL